MEALLDLAVTVPDLSSLFFFGFGKKYLFNFGAIIKIFNPLKNPSYYQSYKAKCSEIPSIVPFLSNNKYSKELEELLKGLINPI